MRTVRLLPLLDSLRGVPLAAALGVAVLGIAALGAPTALGASGSAGRTAGGSGGEVDSDRQPARSNGSSSSTSGTGSTSGAGSTETVRAAPAGSAAAGGAAAPAKLETPGGSDARRAPLAASDESIYVVQRRAYSKSGSFELGLLAFGSMNKFTTYAGPALSAAYHIRENLAVELLTTVPYAIYRGYSGLVYETRDLGLTPELADLKQMTYFGALSLQYSALYGKLDAFNHLVDYDVYVGAGAGLVDTVQVCVVSTDPNAENADKACGEPMEGIGLGQEPPPDASDRFKVAGNLGAGMRVFFADWFGLRFEVRDVVYADRATLNNDVNTDIRNNLIFFLGAGFLL